ncbi:hypothetical protein F5879DRAFT_995327 [Lentinula edodes]|nr:hypothetical protein F5879DRAFT_995327 [Lentinula edodes]
MTTSRTQTTTTSSSTASPSRSCPVPPPPIDLTAQEEEGLEDEDEDEDEIIRRAQACVERAARAATAREKAAQEARERAHRAQQQEEEVAERRRLLAAAATARSQRGTSPSEVPVSLRRPVVEISKKSKGKGKAKAQPIDKDPDDSDDEKEPCERCRTKKISCQMQAGKRSSIICKPCHDAKVRCSYSGRPSTVKREGGSNPTGECLAVLESQVAQLLADNRQLRDGQVKANTYHRHINRKLDWLLTDAVRRRRTPPELPEAGPSGLLKKQRRVMDSDKEKDCEREKEVEEQGMEEDGEGDEEPAPAKGKERAE